MSKLDKIRTMLQSVLATFERISTDNGLLSFDGDELEVGMSVNVVDEEGNETPAPTGEYRTDDGTIYVIEDGKCSEIREAEVEDTTGDDVQPEDVTDEIRDEENASESEGEEEAPAAEEPEAEEDPRDKRIADLEAEVARLEEENGALKERIAELEGKSAAEPATEEFEKVNKLEKTGNKKLDNLTRILNA